MKMRIAGALIVVGAAVAIGAGDRPAGPRGESAGGLMVSAATPALHGQRVIQAGGTVPVVLTNLSERPMRVWRDWCSWGYENVSLEFRDARGHVWTCRKKPGTWFKNYPDFAELGAGESMVVMVKLDAGVWQDLPPLGEMSGKWINMCVRYEVKEDEHSRKDGVWVGKIENGEQAYRIER